MLLAIETATAQVGVALVDAGGPLATFTVARDRRHAETLVPAIEHLTRSVGAQLGDITAIGVDIGPGLFTGLRVGLSTASTLGFALDVPVVGVCSLDALATSVQDTSCQVVAVVDARRGEVFVRRYVGAVATSEPVVADPADLADQIDAGVRLVGDGAHRHADVLTATGAAIVGDPYPAPGAVGALALERLGGPEPIPDVAPLYLRRPDAVANWTSVSNDSSTDSAGTAS